MITLQTLKWDNCFSYGSGNILQLNVDTVTQIIGTNGMGKSSIPLIIEEALFNKNSKGIKKADIPNRYINKGYYIFLSFTKDETDKYEVVVERKASIKIKLLKNGEDISSHTATNTYKTIQEVIGVDFKTFSQLVYQNTNASLQFLTATDANRKKFLIDLLHLEQYVELFEVFKNAAKAVTLQTTAIDSKIATIEKWLQNNKLSDTNILPMLDLDIDTSKEETELRSLTIEIQNISEKNKKISKNNQYKSMLQAIDIGSIQKASILYINPETVLTEQGEVNGVITGSQRTLTRLNKLEEVCPTCAQPINRSVEKAMIVKETKKLSAAREKGDALVKEIKKIKENNDKFSSNKKALTDWENLYRSVDLHLPSELVDRRKLGSRLQEVQTRLQESKNRISEIAAENEKRTKRNTRIQVIKEQTEEFIDQLKECTKELLVQVKLESNLEVLKKSFSTNGLLAYKIENLVKELEELANEYLAELSDGRFTLEFIVSNDKLNVQITDNGNIVDILALSSGELARVNTATLIAIRKLMSSISKSRINVLFLDEVINVLDEAGREKMVEVLLGEDLNTYVVSHGWTHPLLEKIEVVKNGNVSGLE